MRSGVACNKTPWAAAGTNTIPSIYKILGLLRPGIEHLTEKQWTKINNCLDVGDPTDEVNVTWQCCQQLRSTYHATPAMGARSRSKCSTASTAAPSPSSPGWAAHSGRGGPSC
jgi:hypothetical protein